MLPSASALTSIGVSRHASVARAAVAAKSGAPGAGNRSHGAVHDAADAMIAGVRDEQRAGAVDGDAGGLIQLPCRHAIPLKPGNPVPATVLSVPFTILPTRLLCSSAK